MIDFSPRDLRDHADSIRALREYLGPDLVDGLAVQHEALLAELRDAPWREPKRADAHFLGATFAAFARFMNDEVVPEPRLYRLAGLATYWRDLAASCPQLMRSVTLRRRLLNDPIPVMKEIDLAWHFLRQGFDVDPIGLLSDNSPDIRITNGDVEIGIEVKAIQETTGFKVPARAANALALQVFEEFHHPPANLLVRVTCDDRLNERDVPAIGAAVNQAIAAGLVIPRFIVGTYQIELDLLSNNRMVALEAFAAEHRRDPEHPCHELHWEGGGNVGGVFVRSRRPSNLVQIIIDRVREAAFQLAADEPGIVAIHFMAAIDWRQLFGQIDGIVLTALQECGDRSPGLLIFSSEPPIQADDGIINASKPAYIFESFIAARPVPEPVRASFRAGQDA